MPIQRIQPGKRLSAAGVGTLVTTVWGAGYIVRETMAAEPVIDRPVRMDAAAMVQPELGGYMRAEYEKWGRVVRETGAMVN